MNYNSSKNQEITRKLVEREVIQCQTHLICNLLEQGTPDFSWDEMENIYEYTFELDGQWFTLNGVEREKMIEDLQNEIDNTDNELAIEVLEEKIDTIENADSDTVEVFEWWSVNDWFAEKLKEQGEVILDNDYGIWWGRATTGQMIWMDYVIGKIAEDMEILEGQKHDWSRHDG